MQNKQIDQNPTNIRQPLQQHQKAPPQPPQTHPLITLHNFLQNLPTKIFPYFSTNTLTFHILTFNILSWFTLQFIYYYLHFTHIQHGSNRQVWKCILIRFYGLFRPDVVIGLQLERLVLSGVVFNGWLQFYFNNFAFAMLGFTVQRRIGMFWFLGFMVSGMVFGNLCSIAYGPQFTISTGLTSANIALLPVQFSHYYQLPPQLAHKRIRFLYILLFCNFFLNLLSIMRIVQVDWLSHLGSIIASLLLFFIYHDHNNNSVMRYCPATLLPILKGICLFVLVGLYAVLIYWIWGRQSVRQNIGEVRYGQYICRGLI